MTSARVPPSPARVPRPLESCSLLVPEMLTKVLVGAVAEDGHDQPALSARDYVAPKLPRRPHVAAGRNSHEQPFAAGELPHHGVRVLGLDPLVAVRQRRIVDP